MVDLLNQKNNEVSLFEKISSYENLYLAFKECSRGKRSKVGFQKWHLFYGEKLKELESELKLTGNYQWGGYREFFVHDPKKRLIMAAPFKDRIIHTAIYRVIAPIIDKTLGAHTYACRVGMGNTHAASRLYCQLKLMGEKRYCIKLDVKKYFQAINHEIFLENFFKVLPDASLERLVFGLIKSSPSMPLNGIPIGNLTSQLFANFYLSACDKLACEKLGIDFFSKTILPDAFYIRYMDDILVISDDKAKAFEVANELINFAQNFLNLEIPQNKKIIIGKDPIPFLGFVLGHEGYRPLQRNRRRFQKNIRRLEKRKVAPSVRAHVLQSYEAWKNLKEEINVVKV